MPGEIHQKPYQKAPEKPYRLMWQHLLSALERGATTLQVQLRTLLVTAILDGRLPPGLRLPSGRELAALAKVSRNTVVLVYERLVDDGYLGARSRAGYYVRDAIKKERMRSIDSPGRPAAPDWDARTAPRAVDALRWLDRPSGWQRLRYPFVFGQFDRSLFPLREWRECSRQALQVAAVESWAQDGTSGDSAQLIEQLVRRVLPRRGIAATPEQVLLTLGTQHGLYLLAELFAHPGVRFGVEDPGYMDARNIFGRPGAPVVALPVDAQGLVPRAAVACDYLYCTPSHQCPTGITMSTERRLELLAHAAQHDQVVLEDDYDPETQYAGQPLPALKAIDKGDRVIYLSSLSKLLSPGLRLGYIVGPAAVIERLRVIRRLMIRQAPGNNQVAAALFIAQGHYDRLLQRTREVLSRRAGALVEALHRHLPQAEFSIPHGGSSLWLRLPGKPDLAALGAAAMARGVLYDPGAVFFEQAMPAPWIRLGFSSIALERIEPGIRELSLALAEQARR